MTRGSTKKPRQRQPGRCHIRGNCGKKNIFSPELPCPVQEAKAQPPESQQVRNQLVDICGQDFAEGPVCCTAEQVDSLGTNLQQAEALISSCPACRNNFRRLFCSFTCSPNQSQFLDVSATQQVTGADGKPSTAVKSVEYYIADEWKRAFFGSCKDVKFGASNGFAMDLIGGGARDPDAFLKFLGDEKPLVGSPFQINFPHASAQSALDGSAMPQLSGTSNSSRLQPLPFNEAPRHCDDVDLLSRCACVDCPSTCAALPPAPGPHSGRSTCRVAGVSCYAFAVSLAYLLVVIAFFVGYGTVSRIRRHKRRQNPRQRSSGFSFFSDASSYERVRLTSDDGDEERRDGVRLSGDASAGSNGSSGNRGSDLVGARGIGHFGEQASSSSSAPDGLGRGLTTGVGLGTNEALSALEVPQPRKYVLNNLLSRWFYRLGLFCAKRPYLTFMLAAVFVAVSNIGWKNFRVETDPVGLWVAPDSKTKLQKEFFDAQFGPFYRPQQVFLMDARTHSDLHRIALDESKAQLASQPPALTWERLEWLQDLEAGVRELRSTPNGYTLDDVCFAPAGKGTPCVVQSLMGYFQDDLDGFGITEDNWQASLDQCASTPAECLPVFGQPLKPNIVTGGIPELVREPGHDGSDAGGIVVDRPGRASDARAAVTTWVLNNSLDKTEIAKAEEWETALLAFLLQVTGARQVAPSDLDVSAEHQLSKRRRELGLDISFSTGVSLEEEIGSSSNTDVGIVVLSYLLMFLYAALTLGGNEVREELPSGMLDDGAEPSQSASQPGSSSGWSSNLAHFFRGRRGQSRVTGTPSLFPRPDTLAPQRQGLTSSLATFCTRSKFTLGLFGIAIVLISVSCAVGIFSAFNVKVTLIIAEVIPFMLLAVGVDNVFLLCNEMDKQERTASRDGSYGSGSLPRSFAGPRMEEGGIGRDHDEGDNDSRSDDQGGYGNLASGRAGQNVDDDTIRIPSYERAARALSRMGPSILLSATTQIVAFLLGALVPMPAVRNFALYAAGSMCIVATMHCTVFVAAMALDADRTQSGRLDCLPCIKVRPAQSVTSRGAAAVQRPTTSSPESGRLARFIKFSYAPTLLRPAVKRVVIAAFAGIVVLSSIGVRRIGMGLDQRLALPSQSYLRPYFDAVDGLLDVGPPVYFVASSTDPTRRPGQQALCGRFTTCNDLSLANWLEGERRRPEISFLAEPASSWIDDFLQWLNPVLEGCCRVKKRDPSTFCGPNESEYSCQPCFQDRDPPWNITMDGLPEDVEFMKYLQQWLRSPTNEDCPLGGQAAYSSALSLRSDAEGRADGITASHFRTYFRPLRSQADFINALEAAERMSDDISIQTGARVFPYSLFFVFFEQYTYLASMATQILGAAAVAIFSITTLLLGSWRTGLLVTICVASAVFGVAGMMGYWGIQFNALTLVNLSVCSAIGVEFCAHIARAFMRAPGSLPRSHPMSQKERDERAWAALADVGDSVVSGIFSTKLLGVGVLIFTKSDLLKLYYARTWLSLILLGFLHGLVLLPVLLSLFGGRGWSNGEDETDVKRRLQRAGAEYRPLLAGEADEDEEEGSEEGATGSR